MRVWIYGAGLTAVAAAFVIGPRLPTSGPARPAPTAPPRAPLRGVTSHVEMHNVSYRYDSSLAIHIRYLSGGLQPTQPGRPPTFDDKNSFSVPIESAEIATTSAALTTLINNYAFRDERAPVKKVAVATAGDRLKIKGVVHKEIDLPFELTAAPFPTADGNIGLHSEGIRILHLPVKRVLHIAGLHLSDLIHAGGSAGLAVQKDDLILDASRLLPPPRMTGRVTAVRIEGDQMIEIFGAPRSTGVQPRNYMRFTGGIIRFGKLTMHEADLSLIDAEPRDPFEFSLDRYKDQLVAGYSKTTPSFGLEVFMPDVNKIGRARSGRSEKRHLRP